MSRWGGRKNLLQGATWDQDPNYKPEARDIKPSELFPPVPDLPHANALTYADKRIIQNTKALRTAIHQGPLYTESKKRDPFETRRTYSEEQRNALYSANAIQSIKAHFDPFEHGVPTYSLKYARVRRTIPQLSGRPFNKELFPPELHATLEGRSSTGKPGQKKKLLLAMTPAERAIEDQRRKRYLDNLGADEEDAEPVDGDEEVPEDEEDQDDAFEEDEEDMGGDYDAEGYFDDGEGDEDMDEGGGDTYNG